MKKTVGVLVGSAVLAAFAITAPAAQAGHGGTTGLPASPHEPRPTASANPTYNEPVGTVPSAACRVTGTVNTTPPVRNGGVASPAHEHQPASVPEVNDEPSHSHFTFNELALLCGPSPLGIVDVTANGGNDGHQPFPGCTAGNSATDVFGDDANCDGAHDNNNHHGSVNHSAWSHSSGYVAPCTNAGPILGSTNTNKGSIRAINNGTANGWVKYDRLGTVVKAWGTFPCGEGAGFSGKSFWTELAISVSPANTTAGFFAIDGEARIYNGTITN